MTILKVPPHPDNANQPSIASCRIVSHPDELNPDYLVAVDEVPEGMEAHIVTDTSQVIVLGGSSDE
jgi:hypothetical protein